MNDNLFRVRPVLSADACHLRSKFQGTLFMATVKTGNNEIYPVALCITAENESYKGWKFFLENLKKSCPCMVIPLPGNDKYKYYTIISDREKGMIRACSELFPNNHHMHCSVHIARNVQKQFGNVASRIVSKIAQTYSIIEESELMDELNKLNPEIITYINNIDPNVWRSSAWTENHELPPRYGITTSNISESLNSMVDEFRDGSWLDTIIGIIKKMVSRTSSYKKLYEEQKGIIPEITLILKKRFESCSGFTIIQMNKQSEYYVTRSMKKHGDREVCHTVDINDRVCTCGKWQDHQYPCIDGVAVFKIIKKMKFEDILYNNVPKFYFLETQEAIYSNTIEPVIIDTVRPDGETLPPELTGKLRPGAPKKNRLRFRPPKTKVKENNSIQPKATCKRCGEFGHYAKTCEARQKKTRIEKNIRFGLK